MRVSGCLVVAASRSRSRTSQIVFPLRPQTSCHCRCWKELRSAAVVRAIEPGWIGGESMPGDDCMCLTLMMIG